MDGPGDYHTKWIKSDREGQIYDVAYMQNLKKKMIQMNLFTKQKQTHRLREQTSLLGEKGRGRDRLGVWDWQVHIAIFKIGNKDLLYSTGNSAQYPVIT